MSWRLPLLIFGLFFVIAQVVLFAFLHTRKQAKAGRVSPPARVAPRVGEPAPRVATTASAPEEAPPVPTREAESTTLAQQAPENPPENSATVDGGTPSEDEEEAAQDDAVGEERARVQRERKLANRERERRERIQAEREREAARQEVERDRARLKAEKEEARAETELAEKARLEAERERARLEAERDVLLAKRKSGGADTGRPAAPVVRPPAGRPDVLVVLVNSRAVSGKLTSQEIRNIYYGKTNVWPNNTPVLVYGRPAGSPAGRKFYRAILGTSPDAFREHWNQLQLSGSGIAPIIISSPASIMARVSSASGAIGYVLESELTGDVSGVRLMRFK